jgi:hypothetical protein
MLRFLNLFRMTTQRKFKQIHQFLVFLLFLLCDYFVLFLALLPELWFGLDEDLLLEAFEAFGHLGVDFETNATDYLTEVVGEGQLCEL